MYECHLIWSFNIRKKMFCFPLNRPVPISQYNTANFIPYLLKVLLNTQAAHRTPLIFERKGPYGPLLMVGTLQTPLQSWQWLRTRRGVGEGRPITSPAQPRVVIGLHILADAIVWNCGWKDNCLNHSRANISQRRDSRVSTDSAFIFSFITFIFNH